MVAVAAAPEHPWLLQLSRDGRDVADTCFVEQTANDQKKTMLHISTFMPSENAAGRKTPPAAHPLKGKRIVHYSII